MLEKQLKTKKVRKTAIAKYNKQLALFKGISGKKVEIDFKGGRMTSDAGMLILSKIADQLSILKNYPSALQIVATLVMFNILFLIFCD